ncbi:PREDICTED: spliceosome-associated protein CWC15 homolog [Condylura cristata]|uniref:spliceosome-associated protein CWC15 homolog n=1 Tax=Condylura cristata TaxID=143302 RepID=UPI000334403C|nr:PREDICTED: spliceosome-associated protein CWC15 homolog [Condylura cristata]
MTSAARPTFEPARGGRGKREGDLSQLSKQYSSRDLPSHTTIKYRQTTQDTPEEVRNRDFRRELKERETAAASRENNALSTRGSRTSVSKKPRLEQIPIAMLDADDPLMAEEDEDWEEESDGDDTAALLAELEKIKKERAQEQARKIQEQKAEEEIIRLKNILGGNPLLNLGGPAQPQTNFKVKRRWDDDVVFKNCLVPDCPHSLTRPSVLPFGHCWNMRNRGVSIEKQGSMNLSLPIKNGATGRYILKTKLNRKAGFLGIYLGNVTSPPSSGLLPLTTDICLLQLPRPGGRQLTRYPGHDVLKAVRRGCGPVIEYSLLQLTEIRSCRQDPPPQDKSPAPRVCCGAGLTLRSGESKEIYLKDKLEKEPKATKTTNPADVEDVWRTLLLTPDLDIHSHHFWKLCSSLTKSAHWSRSG